MPLAEPKAQILEKYGAYVRSLAAQVRKQFNSQFEMEELVAWGQVGLLEAAERFDARVGANFLTFAHYRIKGAIYDGLRKMGVLKGGAAGGERANAYLGNLSDREGGGGGFEDEVERISSAVTGLAMVFGTSLDGADAMQMSDDVLPADERIQLEQMRRRVRSAIEKLPEKERKLLQGYYFQNKTLEEAGAEIGQSKSWASRLHARAVERLKQLLEDEDDNEPVDVLRRQHHGGSTGRNLGGANRPAEASPAAGVAAGQGGAKLVRQGDEEPGRRPGAEAPTGPGHSAGPARR
ncbi:MAG: sigma-70 family RNA polymerase sigma factor [Myxococcales bacterium]|nr:sigma-70 family RNA polymerase sigma factor [Myxococcales bacterium]MDP3499268.1 sigma-70 family RNA polymerase sigma factor [Myxococcales bacterium]